MSTAKEKSEPVMGYAADGVVNLTIQRPKYECSACKKIAYGILGTVGLKDGVSIHSDHGNATLFGHNYVAHFFYPIGWMKMNHMMPDQSKAVLCGDCYTEYKKEERETFKVVREKWVGKMETK